MRLWLTALGVFMVPVVHADPDLWMRDDASDVGNEPNVLSPVLYQSDDIWVRRTADPNYDPQPFPCGSPTWTPLPHEGPCYRDPKTSSPNYLYVRVRNRGTTASTGNETLHVYWAKASTGLAWPTDWIDHLANPCGGDLRLYGYEVTKPRKNGAVASPAETSDYVAAIQMIDAAPFLFPGSVSYFDKQNAVHTFVFSGINNVHGTLQFFTWHREMMNRYEALLREAKPALTLLYWDWTTDLSPAILGPGGYMGAASGAVGAPFAGFGLTRSKPAGAPTAPGLALAYQTSTILTQTTFSGLWGSVENPAHDSAHCYIGGTVCSFNAARDPMFYMIHANADRIWAMWQRQNSSNVDPWTPAQAYDGSQGAAQLNSNMKPFDGSGSISPWLNQIPNDPDGYLINKTSTHHSIVYPPIYDDVLLRVPVLNAGECTIIEIPFYPPPLTECATFADPQHLCLLARIEPVSVAEGASIWQNVKNNNNIAWRNSTLADCNVGPFFLVAPGRIGAAGELIRNIREKPAQITLRFEEERTGFRSLFEFGVVRLRLEDNLVRAWEAGGRRSKAIEQVAKNEFLVFGRGAQLEGLPLEAREVGHMDVALELNRDYQHPFGDIFRFHVFQFDDQGGDDPVGGQRFDLDFNLLRIVQKGSDWAFLDGGKTPPPGWPSLDFAEEWPAGTAVFGFGRGDVVTGLDGGVGGEPAPAYFRRVFEVPDPTFYRTLAVNLVVDDGVVVYLNGEEIVRLNMPQGPLTQETPALRPATGAAARACRSILVTDALKLLKTGRNVLAAEVHPAREGKPQDLTFDLELAANVPDAPYQPPTVVIDQPLNGVLVRAGNDVPISADVVDPDGDLAEVRVFADGELLFRSKDPPFAGVFKAPPLGEHRVSTEAEDEFHHVTRMEAVFTVVPNLIPTVEMTLPQPGEVFPAGAPVPLSADAADPDGDVTEVAFYVREHSRFDVPPKLVGVSRAPSFFVEAPDLAPGTYFASASARDNEGGVGYSWTVHFLVSERENPKFHRGDADINGVIDVTDAVQVLGFLFLGAPAPACLDAVDADDNGELELTDGIRILGYLFLGTEPPAAPGPPPEPCGEDPTAEHHGDLGCVEYTQC